MCLLHYILATWLLSTNSDAKAPAMIRKHAKPKRPTVSIAVEPVGSFQELQSSVVQSRFNSTQRISSLEQDQVAFWTQEHGYVRYIQGVPIYNYQLAFDHGAEASAIEVSRGQAWPCHSHDKNTKQRRWFLSFKPNSTNKDLGNLCESLPGNATCIMQGDPSEGGLDVVEVSATIGELKQIFQSNRGIQYSEPSSKMKLISDLNVSATTRGSGFQVKGIEESWGLKSVTPGKLDTAGGAGVHVYIFDTGINFDHQDFEGRATPFWDLSVKGLCNRTGCAVDTHGHGTHVAGIVGGNKHGVAKSASLHAVKIISDEGQSEFGDFESAVDAVMTHGDRPAIISASIGAPGKVQIVMDSIDKAVEKGITVIVAAGNEQSDACDFTPSGSRSAVTVGAVSKQMSLSWFSNIGGCVKMYAPGESILSDHVGSDDAEKSRTGTSMAAPFVTGAAAVLLSQNKKLTPPEVFAQLRLKANAQTIKGVQDGNYFVQVPEKTSASEISSEATGKDGQSSSDMASTPHPTSESAETAKDTNSEADDKPGQSSSVSASTPSPTSESAEVVPSSNKPSDKDIKSEADDKPGQSSSVGAPTPSPTSESAELVPSSSKQSDKDIKSKAEDKPAQSSSAAAAAPSGTPQSASRAPITDESTATAGKGSQKRDEALTNLIYGMQEASATIKALAKTAEALIKSHHSE